MSLVWIEPKTDWKAEYNTSGLFIGDFFNITDYNRIKNNLLYLRDLASSVLVNIPEIVVGADKNTYTGYPYADEINMIEDGLEALDNAIPFVYFGLKKTYTDNGQFIDYQELNRLERAELELYELLMNAIENRRRLSFRLGAYKALRV